MATKYQKRPYGSGSIRKYKDGHRLSWRDDNGIRGSEVFRPSTPKQAERRLMEIQTDVARGTYVKPTRVAAVAVDPVDTAESHEIITFADLWREHLAQQEVAVKHSSYRGYVTYGRTSLKAFMTKDLTEIDQRLVEIWWRSQKAHAVNRRNSYFQLRKAFRLAVRWGILPAVPFEIENSGRDASVRRPTRTIEDVDAVLAKLPEFYRGAVEVQLSGHVRISELIALTGSDYRDGWISVTKQRYPSGVVADTKRGQHKRIELLERGKQAMAGRPRVIGSAPLFPGERGPRMTHQAYRNAWNKAVAAAGLENFRTQDLRHVGLTLVSGEASPVVVQERAGHASFTSTRRYLHADARQHAEAVEKANAALRRIAESKKDAEQGEGMSA